MAVLWLGPGPVVTAHGESSSPTGAWTITIRPAHRADATAVNELLDQLGYPQDGRAATANRIEAWAEDPSRAVYTAVAGDDLVGVIAVLVCPFFERDGAWGRIVALVVSDRARGQGIGAQLVAAAEAFAATRGCLRMEVTSADRRHAAHEFYRRCGYVDQAGQSSRFLRDLPNIDAPGERRDRRNQDGSQVQTMASSLAALERNHMLRSRLSHVAGTSGGRSIAAASFSASGSAWGAPATIVDSL
ncbi:GNAT family N-acetyltransferase [Streptomyces sp. NPDC006645]|uniref:GNAT family N-acetyltransferase n=1 Tax=unclassified Streptomyces TaxID=2593676 RepID=UPI0033B43791